MVADKLSMSGDDKAPFTKYVVDRGYFSENPMRIIDIGARGGVDKRWNLYWPHLEIIGFEPEPTECQRLNKIASEGLGPQQCQKFYPLAIHRDRSLRPMYITKHPQCSSFLRPDLEFAKRFRRFNESLDDNPIEVVDTVDCLTIDLDTFARENGIDYVDFIKIDVEGAELAVLEGGEQLITKSACGVLLEVYFQAFHESQPLFSEIDALARRLGFVLFQLDSFSLRRKDWQDSSPLPAYEFEEGQVYSGDALYFRDIVAELRSDRFSIQSHALVKVLKLASLAELFNLQDVSVELLLNAQAVGMLSEGDVGKMVDLLTPQQTDVFKLTKAGYRKLLPPFLRTKVRELLDRFLSA